MERPKEYNFPFYGNLVQEVRRRSRAARAFASTYFGAHIEVKFK